MANRLQFGFKFMPTDEQLIDFYLRKRVEGSLYQTNLILELDVYKYHPQILLANYPEQNDEGYFFTTRARKYGMGNVVKREAVGGFWKMTSSEIIVNRNSDGCRIGKKHVLKYFKGTNSEKEGTDWLMHEYEMVGSHRKFQDLVLYKIYNKAARKTGNQITGWEDEPLGLQQNSYVPDEATEGDEWNLDNNLTFDPYLLLQSLDCN